MWLDQPRVNHGNSGLGRLLIRLGRQLDRQRDVKSRSGADIGRGGKLAAVAFDDHPADRQAHAHAFLLCGDEGVEYPVHLCGLIPGPEVLHGNADRIAAAFFRSNPQFPFSNRAARHSVDRIVHEVEYDLLELPLVAKDGRQFRFQLDVGGDAVTAQIFLPAPQDTGDDVVHVDLP